MCCVTTSLNNPTHCRQRVCVCVGVCAHPAACCVSLLTELVVERDVCVWVGGGVGGSRMSCGLFVVCVAGSAASGVAAGVRVCVYVCTQLTRHGCGVVG